MADDNNQRPYRTNESRATPQGSSASGNDPLAELARLIGQTDPFAEYGRDAGQRGAARPKEASADWPQQTPNSVFPSSSPARAPVTQTDAPQMQPFGGAAYDPQRYDTASFANSAGLYRTENDPAAFAPPAQDEDDQYYKDAEHAGAEDDIYDDVAPPRRRVGIMAVAAVFALAVVGTAGAFGYRALFGASGSSRPPPIIKADATPSKVVPSASSKESNKLITDRVGDNTRNEKLVSREEQPVDIKDSAPNAGMAVNQSPQPSAPLMPANGSGVVTAEPKKIRTIVIRPDQVGMADASPAPTPAKIDAPPPPPPVKQATPRVVAPPPVEANSPPPAPAVPEPRPAVTRTVAPAAPVPRTASNNAPLSLSPNDSAPAPAPAPARPAAPPRPAAAAAPAPQAASGGGYAVQVSSQRSEAEAQAAFRSMQSKYPTQLGGRSPIIHRVDLGAKGIYFRAMVGPFASGNEASELCSSLKSAGGQCIVQKI